jgi:uncharacterized paraquat-inducible protein A
MIMRFFLPFLMPLVSLIVAIWVFYDSQKWGYTVWRGLLWAMGVFLALIIFLPLYLVARKKRERLTAEAQKTQSPTPLTICFYCRQGYEGEPDVCPHCGQKLRA